MTQRRRIKIKRGQVATIVTGAAVTSAAAIATSINNTAQAQTSPDGASTSAASGMKMMELPQALHKQGMFYVGRGTILF